VPSEDGTTEGLVAAALFRSSIDHVTQSEAVPSGRGYWRSKQGREIDFVVPAASGDVRVPIEVKGDGAAALRNSMFSIRRSFGRGLVATRTVFRPDGDVPLIPTPVLLAALGERTERILGGI
jgi:predicted AAA+ superfamily ATPase